MMVCSNSFRCASTRGEIDEIGMDGLLPQLRPLLPVHPRRDMRPCARHEIVGQIEWSLASRPAGVRSGHDVRKSDAELSE